jgi:hypothetical protein
LQGGGQLPSVNIVEDKTAQKTTAGAAKPSKPIRKDDDAAAREKERRRAEAKRLLDQ